MRYRTYILSIFLICFMGFGELAVGQVHLLHDDFNTSDTKSSSFLSHKGRSLKTSVSDHLNHTRVHPLVIRKNIDTFTLEIGVSDSSVSAVSINPSSFKRTDGDFNQEIILYDDGTHGDALSGDNIFTIDQLTTFPFTDAVLEYRLHTSITLSFDDKPPVASFEALPASIRSIDTEFVQLSDIKRVAEDMYMSTHVINLVVDEVHGEYPAQFFGLSDKDPEFPRRGIAKRYYEVYPDDRDFIFEPLLIGQASPTRNPGATFALLGEDVQGINGNFPNNSHINYGSDEHLRGLISLYFTNALWIYNHELLHRWAVGLDQSLGLGSAHWLPVERPTTCFGGSSPSPNLFFGNNTTQKIEHIPDTTLTLGSGETFESDSSHYLLSYDVTTRKCSDLELYLMGLVEPEQVQSPIRVLSNPEYVLQEHTPNRIGVFKADSIRHVTMDEFVRVMGPRIPDYNESQKDFSASYIIPYERPLTNIEMAYFDYVLQEYEKPTSVLGPTFNYVTDSNATISFRLPDLAAYVDVEEPDSRLSEDLSLKQNFPNPFTSSTKIRFDLPRSSSVKLEVYDLLGKQVVTLVDTHLPAGNHEVELRPASLPSGAYIYRLEAGAFNKTRMMMLIR